ncbi:MULTISPECIES: hypothetical protein [unclassified Brenneria]|uniref:hypothetical protein n=1 Tax=unclassified Brenneria TaxID=2634434 RepID=UPI0029C57F94|nr:MULTISPECIES: hypothetical protein [unclassified Brenneria]MDX5631037.1 hypothetical protein [Brenneria sp. L3-3Z]MDX5698126.1 hypothetical protein [Brenneria sp. L4-2C]
MKFINWLMLFGIAPLAACAPKRDLTLSPPEHTQWVDIEVVAPPNTTAFPLNALYRSSVCLHEDIHADMTKYNSRGYNPVHMALQPDAAGRVYRQRVAVDGGGPCEWKLSSISLGIEYAHAEHLVKDAEIGTAVGLDVAFDDEASSSEYYKPVKNELVYTSVYYPYIRESYLGGFKRSLSLYGEKSFMPYRMTIDKDKSGKIVFLPTVDEKKIVKLEGAKSMSDSEHGGVIYPDGSMDKDKHRPDYNKLKNMK